MGDERPEGPVGCGKHFAFTLNRIDFAAFAGCDEYYGCAGKGTIAEGVRIWEFSKLLFGAKSGGFAPNCLDPLISQLSLICSTLGIPAPNCRHKTLGRAERGGDDAHPTVEILVWVLVDDQGRYVADADPDSLGDEYAVQVDMPSFARSHHVVKLRATVPLPRPIEMSASVGGG